MKTFLFLLFLAGAGYGGWWWYNRQTPADVVTFQTVPVSPGTITQYVTASGALTPVVNVTVGCQISGIIQKLNVDFNSQVKAGDVLAELDPAIYTSVMHQGEGELASAKATLELAQLTAKRKQELVAKNAAPQADLDSALATLHQAEATVQIKTASLEKSKVDLSRCTIYSPIDGTIITRSVDVGQTVAASFNAPVLFTVANDLTKMQIHANVAEADVGGVEMKQAVDFTVDAHPYRTFHGVVSQVRNAATTVQNVVTYDVVIDVENPELKLKPGMTANVSIVIAQRESVLRMPNAALRFKPPEPAAAPGAAPAVAAGGPPAGGGGGGAPPGAGGGGPPGGGGGRPGGGKPGRPGGPGGGPQKERAIYVLKDGAPVSTPVKLGITDSMFSEILSGLEDGAPVIIGSTGGPKPAAPPASNPLGGGGMRRP